jgi:hypothetical protein
VWSLPKPKLRTCLSFQNLLSHLVPSIPSPLHPGQMLICFLLLQISFAWSRISLLTEASVMYSFVSIFFCSACPGCLSVCLYRSSQCVIARYAVIKGYYSSSVHLLMGISIYWFEAIKNKSTMNLPLQSFLWSCISIPLGRASRSGISK